MSDSESAAAAPHPTTGGKSMETVQAQQNRIQSERQPYKSWRKKYRKMRVKFDGGKPTGSYDNFMTGFWVAGEEKAEVWGRPADVAQAPDGTLYVVDDTGGTIWRVTARGAR